MSGVNPVMDIKHVCEVLMKEQGWYPLMIPRIGGGAHMEFYNGRVVSNMRFFLPPDRPGIVLASFGAGSVDSIGLSWPGERVEFDLHEPDSIDKLRVWINGHGPKLPKKDASLWERIKNWFWEKDYGL